jgi:flagellar basal body rod protein FlgC
MTNGYYQPIFNFMSPYNPQYQPTSNLGYFNNPNNQILTEIADEARQKAEERNQQVIDDAHDDLFGAKENE